MFATSDPLDLIIEGYEKLAAEDRRGWSTAALGDRITAVAAARERLDAELVRLVGQWDAGDGWGTDGYASPRAWLTSNTPTNGPSASRQVRNARHVQQFDATADALADGAITTAEVELLAEVAKGREELYARDEHVLLDAAKRLGLRDLTTALHTWRHLADDELGTGDPGKGHERIGLHVSPTLSARCWRASSTPKGPPPSPTRSTCSNRPTRSSVSTRRARCRSDAARVS